MAEAAGQSLKGKGCSLSAVRRMVFSRDGLSLCHKTRAKSLCAGDKPLCCDSVPPCLSSMKMQKKREQSILVLVPQHCKEVHMKLHETGSNQSLSHCPGNLVVPSCYLPQCEPHSEAGTRCSMPTCTFATKSAVSRLMLMLPMDEPLCDR